MKLFCRLYHRCTRLRYWNKSWAKSCAAWWFSAAWIGNDPLDLWQFVDAGPRCQGTVARWLFVCKLKIQLTSSKPALLAPNQSRLPCCYLLVATGSFKQLSSTWSLGGCCRCCPDQGLGWMGCVQCTCLASAWQDGAHEGVLDRAIEPAHVGSEMLLLTIRTSAVGRIKAGPQQYGTCD